MIALDRLQQILPADIALANKALSVTLQQISKNPSIKLKEIASAATPMRTCSDLPLVNNLTQPVPKEVADFFVKEVAVGSGPNGTFIIADFFGSLAGIVGLNYIAIVNILSEMDTSSLQSIYTTMKFTVSGDYGSGPVVIPAEKPAAGTYSSIETAFIDGLIPAALAEIANIIALYPFQVSLLNDRWNSADNQVINEVKLQGKAGLDWSDLGAGDDLAMTAWIRTLPQQGLDLRPGGNHWFIQSIANMQLLSGQSVIGCLREGVNQTSMSSSGVNYATNIPIEITLPLTPSEETGEGGSAVTNP
jgi:hypothetical protein